jgi:hypothetical protein
LFDEKNKMNTTNQDYKQDVYIDSAKRREKVNGKKDSPAYRAG